MTASRPVQVLRDLKRIQTRSREDDPVDLLAEVARHYPITYEWAHEPSVLERVSVRASHADNTGGLVISSPHARVRDICEEVGKRVRVARENLEAAADLLAGANRWMQHRHEPETNFGGIMSPAELAGLRAAKERRDGRANHALG